MGHIPDSNNNCYPTMSSQHFSQALAVAAQQHFNSANVTLGQEHNILHPRPARVSGLLLSEPLSPLSSHGMMSPMMMPSSTVVTNTIIQESTLVRSRVLPTSDFAGNNGLNTLEMSQHKYQETGYDREEGLTNRREGLMFDQEKEELKEEVKRLQGLLKKSESEGENIRRELNTKNQNLSQFEKKVLLVEQNKSKSNSQMKALEEENQKLKGIIERLTADRESLTRDHEKYMKSDEAVRVEIFGEIQKLQKVVQTKNKELQEAKQREIILNKKFQAYVNQAGNEYTEGKRDTAHLMEKLKIALEGKELQIESFHQAINQLNTNLSSSENIRAEQLSRIKSMETQLLRREAQNQSFREYQERRNAEASEVHALRNQVVQLQKSSELSQQRSVERVESHHPGSLQNEKDVQIQKLKSSLQSAESKSVTLEHLSKEIHNYKIVVKDLEVYKDNSYKKDIDITRLHQIILGKEKEIVDLENNADILRHRTLAAETQLKAKEEAYRDNTLDLETRAVDLARKLQLAHSEKLGLGQLSSIQSDIQINELTKALDSSRNQFFNLRKVSDGKLFELESVKSDLELKLRQAEQQIDQKESERAFFQNQHKTLYSEVILMRKHSPDYEPLQIEIRTLKEGLLNSEEERNRLTQQIKRGGQEDDRQRGNFQSNEDYTRVRNLIDNGPPKSQYLSVPEQSSGLKEENKRLKHLLEDAAIKIEEYSEDLEQCQLRMTHFQDRMEGLLAGGNNARPGNFPEHINGRHVAVDHTVNELKNKLKLFKKQNDELKRKLKESKDNNPKEDRDSRDKRKVSEKKRTKEAEPKEEFTHRDQSTKEREREMKLLVDTKEVTINQLNKQIEILNSEISGLRVHDAQRQGTIKEYENAITQYEASANQYEARIKDYQNHMLKIKSKYKQIEESHLKLPEPEFEKATAAAKTTEERTEFFKIKSHEAEERVKQLIKINNELKVQLEQTSSMVGVDELATQKTQLLEENISNLERKLRKAIEENFELKARLETTDNNPNLSQILQLKMRQLMEENSDLRVQVSQASNEIVSLKLGPVQQYSSGPADILKLEQLEQKFSELNQIISNLEEEKNFLMEENEGLHDRMSTQVIPSDLLSEIAALQQELYHSNSLNQELQKQHRQADTTPKGVSIQAYNILLGEVHKFLQIANALHEVFSSLADDIDRLGSEGLKQTVEVAFAQARDIFEAIEVLREEVQGLRQRSEAATVIHEINQII